MNIIVGRPDRSPSRVPSRASTRETLLLGLIAPLIQWSERTGMFALSDWRRFIPETVFILLLLESFDLLFLNGTAFAAVTPHPFWIPVLLMASQYGLMGGLFATFASAAVLAGIAMPPRLVTQDFYAYAGVLVGQPTAWLGTALVIGGLRSLHILHAAELAEQLEDTQTAAAGLGDGLQTALAEIDRLEHRIATDSATAGNIASALSRLNSRDQGSLTASFADVIRDTLGATAVTVYRLTQGRFVGVARTGLGQPLSLSDAPLLANGLLDELRRVPRAVCRGDCDSAQWLLEQAVLIVPVVALDEEQSVNGLILVEDVLRLDDVEKISRRASLLARALADIWSRDTPAAPRHEAIDR